MKISLKWLNDHMEVSDFLTKPTELAKLLTDAGLEVEETENKADQFKNVVVGHILKLERHPNADRLTVCQLDVGDPSNPRQIVCGATNHRAGDKVVVTLPGAVLPGNFAIKASKIRDVESAGMLASEVELGLASAGGEGILILPADAPVGQPFAEYRGLDDVIFELKITPNRADCLSHRGLAREIGSLLNRPLKVLPAGPTGDAAVATRSKIKLSVREKKICRRYAGRVVEGVRVGSSPVWLKQRLEAVGLKSINNVVDVTNFVMMDLGQPMHAFDLSHLNGAEVIVAKAISGEKFITLDQTELTLGEDELTIRDAAGPVALAGVIGGRLSGVSESTREIFLESAHFAMDSVRRTARRHGIQTDSAYRFSRGVDPAETVRALDRASALIQNVAGGRVAADTLDEYPDPIPTPEILIDPSFVADRLGYSVSREELFETCRRIGARVQVDGAKLRVTAPPYRYDLEQPADLVEEHGRLNGYDKIPTRLPPPVGAPLAADPHFIFEQRVGRAARGAGLSEAIHYAFSSEAQRAEWIGDPQPWTANGLAVDPEPVRLTNPLSEDLGLMRASLLPGLIGTLLANYRHGATEGRCFETGSVFRRAEAGFDEELRLGLVAWGQDAGLWETTGSEERLFFDLKARLVQILEKLQITSAQFNASKTPVGLVHPGQCATLFVEGRNVGFIGGLHPKHIAREKLRGGVVVGEINLKALSRGQPRVIKFKSIAKFPAVERDIAFLLPDKVAAQDVEREIRRAAGPLLQSVRVFDVFRGAGLAEGETSVAFRLLLQDAKETLDERRLTEVQNAVTSAVERKLGVKVR